MQNRKEFSNSPLRTSHGDFPSGPVVMTNTGDTGLIPSGGTKIPHALGQLSLCTMATEAWALQSPCSATREGNDERPKHCSEE